MLTLIMNIMSYELSTEKSTGYLLQYGQIHWIMNKFGKRLRDTKMLKLCSFKLKNPVPKQIFTNQRAIKQAQSIVEYRILETKLYPENL